MIQLRMITPPMIPQTAGSAVCGALLPTYGIVGPATAGSGASGTLGRAPAMASVVPVTPFPTVEVAPDTAPVTASAAGAAPGAAAGAAAGASGAWRRAPSVSGTEQARRTNAQQTVEPDMSTNDCEAQRVSWIMFAWPLAKGNRPENA